MPLQAINIDLPSDILLTLNESEKELKKRIRALLQPNTEVGISAIKCILREEDPLDIFISSLHIAAEDGLMVTL